MKVHLGDGQAVGPADVAVAETLLQSETVFGASQETHHSVIAPDRLQTPQRHWPIDTINKVKLSP